MQLLHAAALKGAALLLLLPALAVAQIGATGRTWAAEAPGDTATIVQVQEALKQAGFDPGMPSGVLDPPTREALRQYQRFRGLPGTGQLDEQTRAALLGRAPADTLDRGRQRGTGTDRRR
ncbi:MAG: peptidoglycan-binding protein [Acidobacteria bacterium]|nr:MAG: peptidoglycan-binding protein [Acidobacteriota bacterium]